MPQALPLQDRLSQSSSQTSKFRIIKFENGNGVKQRARDGINTKDTKWTFIWENVNKTQRDEIVTALDASEGWDYFTWAPFGDTAVIKVVLTEEGYSEGYKGGEHYTITAVMERDY